MSSEDQPARALREVRRLLTKPDIFEPPNGFRLAFWLFFTPNAEHSVADNGWGANMGRAGMRPDPMSIPHLPDSGIVWLARQRGGAALLKLVDMPRALRAADNAGERQLVYYWKEHTRPAFLTTLRAARTDPRTTRAARSVLHSIEVQFMLDTLGI